MDETADPEENEFVDPFIDSLSDIDDSILYSRPSIQSQRLGNRDNPIDGCKGDVDRNSRMVCYSIYLYRDMLFTLY